MLLHQCSSLPQWHGSVHAGLFRLHEHLRVHVFVDSKLVAPQLPLMSCSTESGAGGSSDIIGISLSPCWHHPSCSGLGHSGCRTRSRDQMFACTSARLMCYFQAPGVGRSLSTLWSGYSCLNICHVRSFACTIESFCGQKSVHRN